MANFVRTSWILALGVGLTLAPACDAPAGPSADLHLAPDDFELPPPDTSLDPDRLTVGDYLATPCGLHSGDGFAHLWWERHEWALVDVFFGRATPAGSPCCGPTSGDIELVNSHGGRVLYSFHVPAVRARVILSRIPGLVADGYWITVRDVPDATRYDVPVTVGFTRPVSDDDMALFVSLGGRVSQPWRWGSINAGVLPDWSIGILMGRPDVSYVQAQGVSCLDSFVW